MTDRLRNQIFSVLSSAKETYLVLFNLHKLVLRKDQIFSRDITKVISFCLASLELEIYSNWEPPLRRQIVVTLNDTKDHYQTTIGFILVQKKMSNFDFFIDLSELSSHSNKILITGDVQGKISSSFLTLVWCKIHLQMKVLQTAGELEQMASLQDHRKVWHT